MVLKNLRVVLLVTVTVLFGGIILMAQGVHDYSAEVKMNQFRAHGGDTGEFAALINEFLEVRMNEAEVEELVVSNSAHKEQMLSYLNSFTDYGRVEILSITTEKFYTVFGFNDRNNKRALLKVKLHGYPADGKIIEKTDYIGIAQVDAKWKFWGPVFIDTGSNVSGASLFQLEPPQPGEEICIMHTTAGVIKIRLFPDLVPLTVENFKGLAMEGFYDCVYFHRTIYDFVIQGGNPENRGCDKPGEPGRSFWGEEPFADEFSRDLRHFYGALSMANAGPTTNTCQFFIVQRKSIWENDLEVIPLPKNVEKVYDAIGGCPHLDHRHSVFGQVFEGMDVVDAIAAQELDEKGLPINPTMILSIEFVPYHP